jgi:hypothetical protein
MPIAGEATFEGCVDKMKEKEGYSDEVAHKVCGKLEHEQAKKGMLSPEQATIAEGTTVAKAPHVLEWEFNFAAILSSPRKIKGTYHVPKIDKDNEIITEGAMDSAMPDYMHLPIISEYHKERPIGLVLKSWKTADLEYQFEGVIKSTRDCDDVWQKVQLGEYDMLSIAGRRTESTSECSLPTHMRDSPCITHGLRLDSISTCDEGARNSSSSLEMMKAGGINDPYLCTSKVSLEQVNFIKAETSNSPLIHETFDGTKKRNDCMTDKEKKCGCKKGETPPKEEKEEEVPAEEEKKAEDMKESPEEKKEEEKKAEPPEEKMEEKEEAKKADGLEAKIDKMIGILEQLVSSDKQVHAEVGKSLTDGKPAAMTEEEVGEKREVEKKAGPIPTVDPAEFSKAMTTIATLQAWITELEGMTVQKSAVVIQSDVQKGDRIESTAEAICKAEAEAKKGGIKA